MVRTKTVRLTKDLAACLEELSAKTGVSQAKLIRDELERAPASERTRSFMRLAGAVRGPRDISSGKGFSRP